MDKNELKNLNDLQKIQNKRDSILVDQWIKLYPTNRYENNAHLNKGWMNKDDFKNFYSESIFKELEKNETIKAESKDGSEMKAITFNGLMKKYEKDINNLKNEHDNIIKEYKDCIKFYEEYGKEYAKDSCEYLQEYLLDNKESIEYYNEKHLKLFDIPNVSIEYRFFHVINGN